MLPASVNAAAAPPDPYTAELDQGLTPVEEALIVALALYLGSAAAITATTLPLALVASVAADLGVPRLVVARVGRMVLAEPLTGRTRHGSPTTRRPPRARPGPPSVARMNGANEPTMRARYILAAAKRLQAARERGDYTRALARERTYMAAHRRAGVRRARIAREYDRVALTTEWLRWRAVLDSRTTPDCAAMHGRVWHRDQPLFPPPGAQHPWCRCRAVPAFRAAPSGPRFLPR